MLRAHWASYYKNIKCKMAHQKFMADVMVMISQRQHITNHSNRRCNLRNQNIGRKSPLYLLYFIPNKSAKKTCCKLNPCNLYSKLPCEKYQHYIIGLSILGKLFKRSLSQLLHATSSQVCWLYFTKQFRKCIFTIRINATF